MWNLWETLVNIRIAELQLYWTRFNAMLLVNGGLLALFGYWNPWLKSNSPWLSVSVSIFGLSFSSLAVRLMVGSHRWVKWWEDKLSELEKGFKKDKRDEFPIPVFTKHPHYAGRKIKHISTFQTSDYIVYLMTLAWLILLLISVSRLAHLLRL